MRAIDFQNLVGLHFGGLGFSLAVQVVLDLAIDVGIVPLPLFIFDIFVCNDAKQLPHLFLRELAVGSRCEIGDGGRLGLRIGGGGQLLLSDCRQTQA